MMSTIEFMQLPTHKCTECTRYSRKSCTQYERTLPEPTKSCRCVHFVAIEYIYRIIIDYSFYQLTKVMVWRKFNPTKKPAL